MIRSLLSTNIIGSIICHFPSSNACLIAPSAAKMKAISVESVEWLAPLVIKMFDKSSFKYEMLIRKYKYHLAIGN